MNPTMNSMRKPEDIPDALRALMVLQKEAARTTPQGTPTVTDQLIQGATQQGQPQPAQGQPQGQPQQPSMQDMVNNSGIAGGVQAQQQQDAQNQMMQMAQQAAQQGQPGMEPPPQGMPPQGMPPQGMPPQGQPQMMAEGGIASLPIEPQSYADGGIIGYAAGGDITDEYTDPMGMLTGMPAPESTYEPTASEKQAEAIRAAMGPISPEVKFDYKEGSDPAYLATQLQTAMRYEKDPAKQAQIKSEVDRLLASIKPRGPSAERAPFGLDLGADVGTSASELSPTDALALAEKFVGATPDRSKIEAEEAKRRKFEEGVQPASTEATTKAYEEEKKRRAFERFILLNEAERSRLGGSGLAEVQFQKSIAERDAAMAAYLEKTRLAEDARLRGNIEKALAYEQDAAKDLLEYNKVRGQVGANVYGTQGSMRNADVQARAQRERANATLMAAALKGMGKNKPTGSTFAEQNILSKMVAENFSSPAAIMKSPDARELIAKAPNGKKLLQDLQKENITVEDFMAHPAVEQARKQFKASLMQQSKYAPGMGAEVKSIDTAEAEDTED